MFGGASKGVDWSYCIKSHHTQTDPGHGLQMSYSSCQVASEQQTSEASYWAREKKNWSVAQWSKVLFLRANFASHLDIKVPESGGRMERHTIQDDGSPVRSFHSLCWFEEPCHRRLVLVHCPLLSPESTHLT